MRALTVGSIAVAGCLAAAVACFSERGAGPVNPGAECSVPVSVIDSKHYIVAIQNFAFHPRSIHIPTGASVTWVNCEQQGVEPHTTTSDGGVWNSPDLSPGNRYTRTFSQAGTFPYHCTPHFSLMKDDTVFVQ